MMSAALLPVENAVKIHSVCSVVGAGKLHANKKVANIITVHTQWNFTGAQLQVHAHD